MMIDRSEALYPAEEALLGILVYFSDATSECRRIDWSGVSSGRK